MKISYNKKADAFSIILSQGKVSKDVEIAKNIFAGFDRSGKVLELQFLEVSKTELPWFTLGAAAKYLDKSEKTLISWIKSGKVKAKKTGREYRINPKELEKFVS